MLDKQEQNDQMLYTLYMRIHTTTILIVEFVYLRFEKLLSLVLPAILHDPLPML